MVTNSTKYFRYNYADEKPEEFSRVKLTRVPVPIKVDDQFLGSSAVSLSGEIVFKISTDLWFRHWSRQVVFNIYTQQTDPDECGRDLQIISLEFESVI